MSIPNTPLQFEHECEQAVGRLRAALIQLFDSVGVDPCAPQDVARKFGLNKTLTWNIARVLQAPDHLAAVPHVPGGQSLERVVETIARHGASVESVEGVRDAVRAFHAMIDVHVGDRSTLDLVVENLSGPTSESLDLSRKLAFRGNSGLYGVQARTRIVAFLAVPNANNPDLLDIATLSGYVGFRRLRSQTRWPLFKVRTGNVQAAGGATDLWDTTGTNVHALGRGVPRFFGNTEPPNIETVDANGSIDYVLMPGSVGEIAAFDCFRGEVVLAAAPRYRTPENDFGEWAASITAPTENVVLDVFVHEDIGWTRTPEMLVFSSLYSSGERDRSSLDASVMPINQAPTEISGRPPAVATPLVPRYPEFFRTMTTRLGADPSRLRAIRLEMKYPPLGSMVSLRFPLPAAPTA